MLTPKTNCPRCESVQRFGRQKRKTTLGIPEVEEIFLRCSICGWEEILEYTSHELDKIRTRHRKAREKSRREIERLGSMSTSTHRMLLRIVFQLSRETRKLSTLVDEAKDGQGANTDAA